MGGPIFCSSIHASRPHGVFMIRSTILTIVISLVDCVSQTSVRSAEDDKYLLKIRNEMQLLVEEADLEAQGAKEAAKAAWASALIKKEVSNQTDADGPSQWDDLWAEKW